MKRFGGAETLRAGGDVMRKLAVDDDERLRRIQQLPQTVFMGLHGSTSLGSCKATGLPLSRAAGADVEF